MTRDSTGAYLLRRGRKEHVHQPRSLKSNRTQMSYTSQVSHLLQQNVQYRQTEAQGEEKGPSVSNPKQSLKLGHLVGSVKGEVDS